MLVLFAAAADHDLHAPAIASTTTHSQAVIATPRACVQQYDRPAYGLPVKMAAPR
jgi:hypothetical protein